MVPPPIESPSSPAALEDTLAWRDELVCALLPHVLHRLGNLLTVVMGTADLLALDEPDPARAVELDAVVSGARRATVLARALGMHARSRPGPLQALDLRELVDGLEPLAGPVAKAAGYGLEIREAGGMTVVRSDEARLQLLLLGLVVGAAAPGEGLLRRDGQLTLRVVELGHRVAVLVSLTIRDGEPVPALVVASQAKRLAAELGANLRTRSHPGGTGQSLLLGLPALA